jgi:hypothetical protein
VVMAAQVSSIQRLLSLPALFSGKDLTVRFQWTSKAASQYLYLWKKRGLVQALGGHSDVFANLLVQPQPDWEAALRTAMPSAVIVGVDALRRAGWTTQVPSRPEVAVQAGQPRYSVERFSLHTRPASWFDVSRPGIREHGLHPAWALADMLKSDGWQGAALQPDDLDWGGMGKRDQFQFAAACRAYSINPSKLTAINGLLPPDARPH